MKIAYLIFLYQLGLIDALTFRKMCTNCVLQYLSVSSTEFITSNNCTLQKSIAKPIVGLVIGYDYIRKAPSRKIRAARLSIFGSMAGGSLVHIISEDRVQNMIYGEVVNAFIDRMDNVNNNRTTSLLFIGQPGRKSPAGIYFSEIVNILMISSMTLRFVVPILKDNVPILIDKVTEKGIILIYEGTEKGIILIDKVIEKGLILIDKVNFSVSSRIFKFYRKRSKRVSQKIRAFGKKLLVPLKYVGFIDRKLIKVTF